MNESTLGAVVMRAVAEAEEMRRNGADRAAVDQAIEATIRQSWPKGRTWKYVCDECADLGWTFHDCPSENCGRLKPHMAHRWVCPCFCAKGQTMREKPQPSMDDELAAVGKVRKPTRFGR